MRRVLYVAAAPVLLIGAIFLTRLATGAAANLLERRYPPPGVMTPVGGYKLQLYCMGAGSPTVIIEPGMGVDWVGWRRVISKLVDTNRVCVYDRAGYGWSEPGPKPRTAARESDELNALLAQARVPQPYILAAHSYGAYIARIFASRRRETLTGVVLVDPSHEDEPIIDMEAVKRARGLRDLADLLPPLGIQRLRRMYDGESVLPPDLRGAPRFYQSRYLVASSVTQLKFERNEFDSLRLSNEQVRQAAFPRDLPLTVISAARQGERAEMHAKLARSSDCGKLIVASHSGHMIPLDEPEVIVDAVLEIAHATVRPSQSPAGTASIAR
jgi:pimeloyl-ACP methyl ester carboxylesterase